MLASAEWPVCRMANEPRAMLSPRNFRSLAELLMVFAGLGRVIL
jgi:hypothetical protein